MRNCSAGHGLAITFISSASNVLLASLMPSSAKILEADAPVVASCSGKVADGWLSPQMRRKDQQAAARLRWPVASCLFTCRAHGER